MILERERRKLKMFSTVMLFKLTESQRQFLRPIETVLLKFNLIILLIFGSLPLDPRDNSITDEIVIVLSTIGLITYFASALAIEISNLKRLNNSKTKRSQN